MLIEEVIGIDVIAESDEYALKSSLDAIILDIKDKLEQNKNAVITLDGVIGMLNARSSFLAIDPRDDDRRNFIIQQFQNHGMDVERGAGKITLQHMDVTKTDQEEVEKEQKTKEISKKAMDKVKKDNEGGAV